MATVVITVVTSQSVADIKDLMQLNGNSTWTITNDVLAKDRVARWIDGVANEAYTATTFTVAAS